MFPTIYEFTDEDPKEILAKVFKTNDIFGM